MFLHPCLSQEFHAVQASVYFKNVMSKDWEVNSEAKEQNFITDSDRNAIKTHIVKLVCLCGSFADVRHQLSQALTIIAASDFPEKWPNLLPELVKNFESDDRHTVSGMLLTANSILKRFRYAYKSDHLYRELEYALGALAAPLTTLFTQLGREIEVISEDSTRCCEVLECLRLVCRIFFSLNWQDLPEFFEDHMTEWMGQFDKYLSYENGRLLCASGHEGIIERLQAAIVDIASLYAQKYEEEFRPFLPRFVSAIWQLLVKLSSLPHHDHLATKSIHFLAEIIGKQMHASIFSDEKAIRHLVEAVVVPSMRLRDSDIELFDDSPFEYISRDFETNDAETRRRSACDLIAAMCKHHEDTTAKVCVENIMHMLQVYSDSPSDHWHAKDAAIHLVVALTVRGDLAARGAKTLYQLNTLDMYFTHIACDLVPHLCIQPIILADAVQFVCTFRKQIPPEELVRLLPILAQHLRNTAVVVQSYAAICIERVITLLRSLAWHQLKPLLNSLCEALLEVNESAVSKYAVVTNSIPWENEYAMKAVMRLLVVGQREFFSVAGIVTEKLCHFLSHTCRNPRNPRFNHYLFESLAILVRVACANDSVGTSTSDFEKMLFPLFQLILQMDVVEFAPYVFQILALLLGYQRSLSASYSSLLPPLLHPSLWERQGNVPALCALLEAYLVAGADHIVLTNQLEPILGVFQKLLASKVSESNAFGLLQSIILHVDSSAIDTYVATVLQLIMASLQQNRDHCHFCHKFFAFLGLYAGKRGGTKLVHYLEIKQAGLLSNLVLHVFTPQITKAKFADVYEAKAAAVGSTHILCEAPDALIRMGDVAPWNALGRILYELLRQLTCESPAVEEIDERQNFTDGYDAHFSKLHFGSNPINDAFPDIQDVQKFALSHLQQSASQGLHFRDLISSIKQLQ